MDVVTVRGLEVSASVGIYPFEATILQQLFFDVFVELDLEAAAIGDDLDNGLDYDAVSEVCRAVARERHHRLIESLALRCIHGIFELDSRIASVEVEVHKPGAVPDAADVSVRLKRRRNP
ncbi:MAG: dihydroneopterin aldolase [Myxococcota bacterium]